MMDTRADEMFVLRAKAKGRLSEHVCAQVQRWTFCHPSAWPLFVSLPELYWQLVLFLPVAHERISQRRKENRWIRALILCYTINITRKRGRKEVPSLDVTRSICPQRITKLYFKNSFFFFYLQKMCSLRIEEHFPF